MASGSLLPPPGQGKNWLQAITAAVNARLLPLLNERPAPHILLLGEQHDAPYHHVLEHQVVVSLLRHGRLGALALEMAERGRSTVGLQPNASDDQVQRALAWNEAAWPWADYGPAIMAAVRDEVPVLGANMPHNQQRDAMKNEALDGVFTAGSLKKQEQSIIDGHCGLLAASQIRPMTRIQIARDQAMARTAVEARQIRPATPVDQLRWNTPVVLVIAGGAHVDRLLGIPQHLPAGLIAKVIVMQSDNAYTDRNQPMNTDAIWVTAAAPAKDYCAEFSRSRPAQAQP